MTVSIPNAKLRTRRYWLARATLALGLLGLPAILWATWAGLFANSLLLAIPAVFLASILGTAYAVRRWLLHRAGELRADATGLFLDGQLVIARKALSYGHVVTERGQLLLRLISRWKNGLPVDVEIGDEAQANELLAALGIDRTVVSYTLSMGRFRPSLARIAYGTAGLFVVGAFGLYELIHAAMWAAPSAGFVVLPFVVMAVVFAGAMLAALSSVIKFSVGLDGVWIHRRFVEKRFVPFRQIVSVEQTGADVTLKLADHTTHEFHHHPFRAEDGASFVAKVRAGMEASHNIAKHAGESVARNGRSVTEWIANAAKAHERAANYRAPVVPDDELWRIVEDPTAGPTERAGAALALRAELSDDGKARLRVAAGTCAEKRLRVALESVVAADDEALAAALEPLDDAASKPRLALSRS